MHVYTLRCVALQSAIYMMNLLEVDECSSTVTAIWINLRSENSVKQYSIAITGIYGAGSGVL